LAFPSDLPRTSLSIVAFSVVREGLDPLAITGSLKAGGRFNPPNEFAALYTSLDASTAAQEVARGLRQRGIDPAQFPEGSWWLYELEVKLDSVLDLTDASVLTRIGLAENSLTGNDVSAARQVAAEARRHGYRALLVPSAATPGARNLVIFSDLSAEPPFVLSSRPVRLGGR
jgi:RES domain-containing protein